MASYLYAAALLWHNNRLATFLQFANSPPNHAYIITLLHTVAQRALVNSFSAATPNHSRTNFVVVVVEVCRLVLNRASAGTSGAEEVDAFNTGTRWPQS